MVHVFHQIPFEMPSGVLLMNLFASIYERETPRCSTVYIDNSLGPLATESPCISVSDFRQNSTEYFMIFLHYEKFIKLNLMNGICT